MSIHRKIQMYSATVLLLGIVGLATPKVAHAAPHVCNEFCWHRCEDGYEGCVSGDPDCGNAGVACFYGPPCDQYAFWDIICYKW